MPDELKKVGTFIVEKYSTTQEPKPPSIKVTRQEEPTTEGIGSFVSGIWGSLMTNISKWGKTFDGKLKHVADGIKEMYVNIPTIDLENKK